jgi:ligand-binding sensor domain-containing protein
VTHDGTVWAGTTRGLFRFEGGKWVDSKVVHSQVMSLAEDPSGGIWIGGYKGAVYFDGKSVKTYTVKDGLVGTPVLSIAVAGDGSVWFGTLEGASHLVNGKWKNYTQKDGLSSDNIVSVAVAPDGKVLLAISLKGVAILNPSH